MGTLTAEVAFAAAWRTYLLLHNDVSEDDDRRATLRCYISNLFKAGENDPDALRKAGLLYLRRLDELGEERDEKLARYRAPEEQTRDPLAARSMMNCSTRSRNEPSQHRAPRLIVRHRIGAQGDEAGELCVDRRSASIRALVHIPAAGHRNEEAKDWPPKPWSRGPSDHRGWVHPPTARSAMLRLLHPIMGRIWRLGLTGRCFDPRLH